MKIFTALLGHPVQNNFFALIKKIFLQTLVEIFFRYKIFWCIVPYIFSIWLSTIMCIIAKSYFIYFLKLRHKKYIQISNWINGPPYRPDIRSWAGYPVRAYLESAGSVHPVHRHQTRQIHFPVNRLIWKVKRNNKIISKRWRKTARKLIFLTEKHCIHTVCLSSPAQFHIVSVL